MDQYQSYTSLPDSARNAVVVIGNFDGVHRGHCGLFDAARTIAKNTGRKLAVLTFEPHPRHIFRPDDPPFRITPAGVKADRLAAHGVDILISLNFDWPFASQSADHFIQHVLKDGLNAAHVVVGRDFRFGQLRKGDAAMIDAAGIPITVMDKIADDDDGDDISSTRIRQALGTGDIAEANALLGWDWEMRGVVEQGDKRGRELGFPTANVPLGDTLHPAYGVYATWTKIVEDGPDAPWIAGATNIGIRPMFELKVGRIENYLFDFNRDIYGKTLRVRPVARLRGEAKFDGLDALIAQIKQDCDQAQDILGKAPPCN
ncbi:bifunctional riboflavin kinase/FAD synthetase [Micavibrio aeruginosavorus]|uniref:Riboflavin biosynthesis protein n=1 Tax=Micavibrio aeruginosavorus (strain ARL-13) TaxID=856793 RepID=G2KQ24_MICAA|nr:bifunctional riboflavin kinase/FAD synthetase [Micavibrio aeruginosavorus]AEP10392.1 riboflavin biosynthesis protein RibF [Micavibrio aeruginosavorus ARL-13]